MIIGLAIIVVAIFVVFVGTQNSEAIVLYYDAEASSGASKESSSDYEPAAVEDFGNEAELDVRPEPEMREQPKRVTVTVGGNAINKSSKSKAEESFADLKAAARANDPNKTAQSIFDEIKGGRI